MEKFNFFEDFFSSRQHALDSWNRVYEKFKRKEIHIKSVITAMGILNNIDRDILKETNLTNEEKDKIFDISKENK